ELAKGDYLFLIPLKPRELRVASHFTRHDMSGYDDLLAGWMTIMKCVYLLQSLSVPTQRYVGVTRNLVERLRAHNSGASSHTSKYLPWKVVIYLSFQDDRRALEFERYLKTGSGQAFVNKRLCRSSCDKPLMLLIRLASKDPLFAEIF